MLVKRNLELRCSHWCVEILIVPWLPYSCIAGHYHFLKSPLAGICYVWLMTIVSWVLSTVSCKLSITLNQVTKALAWCVIHTCVAYIGQLYRLKGLFTKSITKTLIWSCLNVANALICLHISNRLAHMNKLRPKHRSLRIWRSIFNYLTLAIHW